MIRFEFDYETRTVMGSARCNSTYYIYDEYRDIAHVEEAVKVLKKLFTNKAINSPCVTISFTLKDFSTYDVSRFWHDYDNFYEGVVWHGENAKTYPKFEGMTAKFLREKYLECADLAIAYEADVERARKEAEEAV